MIVTQRNTITHAIALPGLLSLALLWLVLLLPAWAGTSWAATVPAAIAPATMDRQVPLPDEMSPEELSSSDWQSIRAAYEASRHAVAPSAEQPGSYKARNPGQQWLSTFNGRGVTINPDHGNWQWGLTLERWGRAGQEQEAAALADIDADGQRTVYRYSDGLKEWFVNDRRGLEHGFTVPEPPCLRADTHRQAAGSGEVLRFELRVSGGLTPRVAADGYDEGRDVAFVDAKGHTALTYNGLNVQDADGRMLAAHFASDGKQLTLSVDARGARYPITIDPILQQQAYLKASNTEADDWFGSSVAASGDTVVVGAPHEDSSAIGVNGNEADNLASNAGAAYVFVRDGAGTWSQQAYLKASNTDANDQFGVSVAIAGDTVVVGAWFEDSDAKGVNGNNNNLALNAGAAYVFVRTGSTWSQTAYLKASNTDRHDGFGESVAVAGSTLVVGASSEDSSATGVNGNQRDNSAADAGAAYVFVGSGSTWSQTAYLKASNTDVGDGFGNAVAVSNKTVVVGAKNEDSNAAGVNGDQVDNSASGAGAAYVFTTGGGGWSQQAYLKASNSDADDRFGQSVAIDLDTVVVGANREASIATGVNGDQASNVASFAGAAYVFVRSGSTWSQQAYLKASNTASVEQFGWSVAASGNTVVVGADLEDSNATGVNGNQGDNSAARSGAAYLFVRTRTTWSQQAYLKASNTDYEDHFGGSVAVSGSTVVVGTSFEDSIATGVNGNQGDNSAPAAGAAYVFALSAPTSFTIGGTVSGLAGTGLVLQNNGTDNLSIAADGAFTFATPLADGSAYNVTVFTQPSGPSQTCSVTNGSGTIAGADVTNVEVNCSTNTFTIGGTVSGLAGTGLVLQNNGGDNRTIAANGAFTFTAQDDGTAYNVTVASQPAGPAQFCSVTNGSGTLAGANVTNVIVNCAQISIDILPERLVFGDFAVGQTSPTQMVVVENTGQVSFEVQMISLSGANSGDFVLSMDTCTGVVLGPSDFCGFEVAFAPTAVGVRQAELVIDTDLFAQPFRISVVGTSGVVFFDGFEAD